MLIEIGDYVFNSLFSMFNGTVNMKQLNNIHDHNHMRIYITLFSPYIYTLYIYI